MYIASEYEELRAEKAELEAEFGQIVEGQTQAVEDNRDDAIFAGNQRKDEIRKRFGEIDKRIDEILGS